MSNKNLLVELFVEELPPKALKKIGAAFAQTLRASLQAQGLITGDSKMTEFASPRRLAVHLTQVATQAADKSVSQKLMPVSVGLNAEGKATPALLKKLAALGADESAVAGLMRQSDGKAEALYFSSTAKGATLADGLQSAIDEALNKLPIPKVMTYQLADGWESVNFVRPAHGLVALHGGDVVPLTVLGLSAGNTTHGHRFEAAVDPIVIRDANSYAEQLAAEGSVIANFSERRAEIVRQLNDAAAKAGSSLTPIHDDALLDEVTGLVERPNVLTGRFEEAFLDVPQECLILTMKANQKYFPLLEASGKLSNQFLIVSNIRPADASAVIGGNERVVRPRLADAKFFFDQDRKKTLASRVPALGKVVYHNKLGSQGERMERVRIIAQKIAGNLGGSALMQQADQAALLAKTDLVTDMVGEFPELQGIMGRYYALNDGLHIDIADAIEDHYKPRFAGDELPRNKVGIAVALADKLETLIGLFGIGQIPTGDKDPFALRRHALGVVRISLESQLDFTVSDLIYYGLSGFGGTSISLDRQMLHEFISERFANYLREQNYPTQNIDAVLSVGDISIRSIASRLEAVKTFSALPEAQALAAANKRVGNILKKTEGKIEPRIDSTLLKEAAEIELSQVLATVKPQADAAFERGDYATSLQALAVLKAPVDAFFDGVMVNAEDPALRHNRLGLLATLHQAMNRVADISKLAA